MVTVLFLKMLTISKRTTSGSRKLSQNHENSQHPNITALWPGPAADIRAFANSKIDHQNKIEIGPATVALLPTGDAKPSPADAHSVLAGVHLDLANWNPTTWSQIAVLPSSKHGDICTKTSRFGTIKVDHKK